MNESCSFSPEWASPPGATIADMLEHQGRSTSDFATAIGTSRDFAEKLLNGSAFITEDIAATLSRVLGAPASFWLTREQQFRQSLSRLALSERWISDLPWSDMAKFGWIENIRDPKSRVNACLGYFGVATLADWREKYEGTSRLAAFRASAAFSSAEGAVLTWLRKGEIEAEKIQCASWDRELFRSALPTLRALSRAKEPSTFLPQIQRICAECGIAVVVARAPSGCRASGATRFLEPNRALLMLSFRHLSDDHFWFTFFHEAGHLLLHDSSALFLEGGELCTGNEEQEANDFSSSILVPVEHREAMLKLPLDGRAVMRFARHIGTSPGIVVGQLQYFGRFAHNQLNNLKTRYVW